MSKYNFLSDNNFKKDSFGIHTNIANTITNIIKDKDLSKSSFNLGIFGDWGSGKSFIVEKIDENLTNEENIIFIKIDVWKFIGMPLMRSILIEIDKSFREISKSKKTFGNYSVKFPEKWLQRKLYTNEVSNETTTLTDDKWKEKIKNLFFQNRLPLIAFTFLFILALSILIYFGINPSFWGSILSSSISTFLIFGAVFEFIKKSFITSLEKASEIVLFKRETKSVRTNPNFSSEQFEETFSCLVNFVKDKNSKLILVFDNIDRCDPKMTYEILSTIKTYMDLNHCFCIIPCDDDALLNYLAKEVDGNPLNNSFEREFSREFIDKFFQTYFRIPKLKEVDRNSFIKEQFNDLAISELSEENINNISSILYYAYKGLTPRQIKRFINDFAMYYYIALESDTNRDLLLKDVVFFTIMITIKQRWDKFETYLIENPHFFKEYLSDKSVFNNFITSKKLKESLNYTVSLENFLDKVSLCLLPDESVLNYIYFKESDNANETIENLRNGNIINLNSENEIVIKNYLSRETNETFITYTLISIFKSLNELLLNNKELGSIKTLFWEKFILLQSETQYKIYNFIAEKYLNTDILLKMITEVKLLQKDEVKREHLLVEYILKNNNEKLNLELLKYIIDKDINLSEFNRKELLNVENDLNLTEKIVKTIPEKNKATFIPKESVSAFASNIITNGTNNVNEIILEILSNITFKVLNDNFKDSFKDINSTFLKYTNSFITNLDNVHNSYIGHGKTSYTYIQQLKNSINNYISNFKIVSNFLHLIPNTNKEIYEILKKIATYCIHLDNDSKYKIYSKLLSFISNDYEDFNDIIIENIQNKDFLTKVLSSENSNFMYYAFKNKKFKDAILNNVELYPIVYNSLDFENFNIEEDFKLYQLDIFNLENLKLFIKIYSEKVNNFSEIKANILDIIFDNSIKEIQEQKKITLIEYLNNEGYDFSLKIEKITENRIIFINFYKNDPQIGDNLFLILKKASQKEFKTNFLSPVLEYIESQLKLTYDVSKFNNINSLIDNNYLDTSFEKLLNSIKDKLLEKGKEPREKILGIELHKLTNKERTERDKKYKELFTKEEIDNNKTLEEFFENIPVED